MRGINQMLQMFVSLQILFGSRRGVSFVLPLLLLVGLGAGAWFLFGFMNSPQKQLDGAHADWDSGATTRQISAIVKYKELLQKDSPIEPGTRWLQSDRDTLYRRIVEHQVLYEKDKRGAREWIIRAWDEGIRDLRFGDGEVNDYWEEATDSLRNKRSRGKRSGQNDEGRVEAILNLGS